MTCPPLTNLWKGAGAERQCQRMERSGNASLSSVRAQSCHARWEQSCQKNTGTATDLIKDAVEVGRLSLLLFNKTQIKGDILYVTGGDDGSAQDMDEVRTSWGHSDHTKRTWPTWQCQYFEHLFPKPSSRCWLGTGLLRRGHLPDTWQHQGELFVGTIIYSNLRDTLKTIEGLKSLWEMFCFNKQPKNCWKGGSAGSQLNQ